jgi:putative phage-type endonuclease
MRYEVVLPADAPEDEWLDARFTGITSSDAGCIMGEGRISALELWMYKTGRLPKEDLDNIEYIHWGKVLEPVIIGEYSSQRYSGRETKRDGRLIKSKQVPYLLATLDAETVHHNLGVIPLECKNVSGFMEDGWVDGLPRQYFWQLMHQMLVHGSSGGSIAALMGGNKLVWTDEMGDQETFDKMLEAYEDFWRCVRDDTAPKADGSESATRALVKLYDNPEKTVNLLPVELIDADDELQELKAQKKDCESRIRELENSIREKLGNHEEGLLPNGVGYTWKEQERSQFIVKAAKIRVLRRRKAA